jgi:hypothetical protein
MASGADAAAAGVAGLGISGAGEWAAACPPLRRNLHLLAPDEVSAACLLLVCYILICTEEEEVEQSYSPFCCCRWICPC